MMMSEEIRLERTEIAGHVTLTPKGRVMYTIAEYETLKANRDRWRNVAQIMYGHLVDDGSITDAMTAFEEAHLG
jgi:hypothetical protein